MSAGKTNFDKSNSIGYTFQSMVVTHEKTASAYARVSSSIVIHRVLKMQLFNQTFIGMAALKEHISPILDVLPAPVAMSEPRNNSTSIQLTDRHPVSGHYLTQAGGVKQILDYYYEGIDTFAMAYVFWLSAVKPDYTIVIKKISLRGQHPDVAKAKKFMEIWPLADDVLEKRMLVEPTDPAGQSVYVVRAISAAQRSKLMAQRDSPYLLKYPEEAKAGEPQYSCIWDRERHDDQ